MKAHASHFAVAIVIFAVLLGVTGCKDGPVTSVVTGGPAWNFESDNPIPGIHKGTVETIVLNDVAIVIWCDRSCSSFNRASGDDSSASSKGRFVLPSGREIAFHAATANDASAKVDIAGNSYDTTNGSLFLISTQSAAPRIKQMVADLSKFPTEANAIVDYAHADQEISGFYTHNQAKKAAEPTE